MSFSKTIEHAVIVKISPSQLWDMLTDTNRLAQWLSDGEITITTTWEVGCPICFDGVFHGITFHDKGSVRQFEPQSRITYSYWSAISRLPDEEAYYTVIEIILESQNEQQTKLSVRQRNLINEEIFGHWNFYWRSTLALLPKLIES